MRDPLFPITSNSQSQTRSIKRYYCCWVLSIEYLLGWCNNPFVENRAFSFQRYWLCYEPRPAKKKKRKIKREEAERGLGRFFSPMCGPCSQIPVQWFPIFKIVCCPRGITARGGLGQGYLPRGYYFWAFPVQSTLRSLGIPVRIVTGISLWGFSLGGFLGRPF